MNQDLSKHADSILTAVPEEHRRRGIAGGVGAARGGIVGSIFGGPLGAAVGSAMGGALGVAVAEKSQSGGAE